MDRRTMMIRTAVAAAAASASIPILADTPQPAAGGSLNALFDQFMKENLDLSPLTVTSMGLDTGARAHQKFELDDFSLRGIERGRQLVSSQRKRLEAVNRAALSPADQVGYGVVDFNLRTTDEADKAFRFGGGTGAGNPYVLSQLNGSYQSLPSTLDTEHTIERKSDAEAYLSRLSAFGHALDQEIEVAHHDVGLGVTPPDFVLDRALEQMRALRALAPAESSMVGSLARRTREKNIPGDWAGQAAAIVRDKVYPALDRQIALLEGLRKTAVHDAGVWRLPQGHDYYAASLVGWTTSSMKPEDIHKLGLQVVQEHTALIDALMRKQGLTQGSVAERFAAMYKDPRYLYANTDAAKEELIADLNRRVQRIRAKLPQYFGALPRANVEIRRVPKAIEAGAPGGYYNSASLDGKRPGIYWINLRDTSEVPRWALPTLTYHESIPGHHLQISIQQEANLPLIRKTLGFSAYVEGWALYAEQLAVEMGEYEDDPLGHIGQLHDSMFRGVRLVVDSGMHALKWSREKAIRYYTETLGNPATEATTEVERYCVWPGQACSYMLGKLKILAIRDQARKSLGTRFDIHSFHDAVLLPGALPLDMMDHLYG